MAVVVLTGVGLVALGGLAAMLPGRLRAALAVQAAGVLLIGAAGAAIAAGGDPVGAAFRSDVAPAFGIDGLSGFFLAVLAITAAPTLAYAGSYLAHAANARALGALMAAFLLALTGVLAARDVTTFLGGWELMTLVPAAAILVARRDKPVRDAIYAYLAITHLGGGGVWVALLTLAHHGALGDPGALAAAGSGAQALVAGAALVGFGTKAGFVPLHSWLPRAHPVAPAPLSALMSGLMVKVALYGLIRVVFEWLGATPRWLGLALLACGALSALGGALWALVQPDLKRVLAYSTIENVGIVALALGASLLLADGGHEAWAALAFAAALLHIATHALAKTLLFLGAGAVEKATGTLELDSLGGLLARMPQAGGALLVGCVAIAGLPPLSGFASEWLALQSLLHAAFQRPLGIALAAAVGAAALAMTAALAVLCFVQVAGLVLLGPPRTEACASATEPARAMRLPLVLLGALCVVLGILPGLVVPALADLAPGGARLGHHAGLPLPGTGTLPAGALVIALVVLVAALVRARGTRRAAPAPTWTCGQPLVPALRWTSAGFTKPVRLVLESVLRPVRKVEVVHEGGMVQRVEYSAEVPSIVDRALLEPAIATGLRAATVARRLQTGNVRTYAGYLLALVVLLLALARVGVLG